MNINKYFTELQRIYATGTATEHSYRPALESLFNQIDQDVRAQNEPRRVEVGAPDFVFVKNKISVAHAEAKDISHNLRNFRGREKDQFYRYLGAFSNLLYTNGLDFIFYHDGKEVQTVRIGEIQTKKILANSAEFSSLENALRNFISQTPLSITRPDDLAERMAGKAALIKDVLARTLHRDRSKSTSLAKQYAAFQKQLIQDMSVDDFAGMYAETVAYGMFAARLHDTTVDTFSRHEAMDRLPKSNPFLRSLFSEIAGPNLDEDIRWVIDDLVEIFRATNPIKIVSGFGKLTGRDDPFLHFYETFLTAYDPEKRKARGVWYTPQAVVNFIVRAVDEVLQSEFNLPDGLADTSKVKVRLETGQRERTVKGKFRKDGRMGTFEREVHRVQILDPATGTGTFLAEVIRQIAPRIQHVAPGMWSSYVERELIPRLHGFELLMASYAMCHIKLDMMLEELGYTPTGNPPRLSVYLTNSLEEGDPIDQALPFAAWLSDESKAANEIKRDMPIMCVIGNPPYNPSSKNSNVWINGLMADYRKGVNDRKVNLNDDYMKFIRLAESYVEKVDKGVVAMITNNSFLDGTTQRGMRRHLYGTFDSIYVYNLHGDIRSQQKDSSDENVFDITQGVAICIFIKGGNTGGVYYKDIIGRRSYKNKQLLDDGIILDSQGMSELNPKAPYFFFYPNDLSEVSHDFSLEDMFVVKSSGIQTKNDPVAIAWTAEERDKVSRDFKELTIEELSQRYEDKEVWKVSLAKKDFEAGNCDPRTINYRPFDIRHTVLTKTSNGFLGRPRYAVMKHIGEDSLSLVVNKKHVGDYFSHVSVAKSLVAHGNHYLGNRGQDIVCPLYISELEGDAPSRVNFAPDINAKFLDLVSGGKLPEPSPEDIFDYVYAVLHCPAYRKAYSELLKVDYPRIPWPSSPDEFWRLVPMGNRLRRLHLMDPRAVGDTPYQFVGAGDNIVRNFRRDNSSIWINETQRFENVPNVSWSFPIGGYEPAQKWLKDRKGRVLSFNDVKHYQKILKILAETDATMREIHMDI